MTTKFRFKFLASNTLRSVKAGVRFEIRHFHFLEPILSVEATTNEMGKVSLGETTVNINYSFQINGDFSRFYHISLFSAQGISSGVENQSENEPGLFIPSVLKLLTRLSEAQTHGGTGTYPIEIPGNLTLIVHQQ